MRGKMTRVAACVVAAVALLATLCAPASAVGLRAALGSMVAAKAKVSCPPAAQSCANPKCRWACDKPVCPAKCHHVCEEPQCAIQCEELPPCTKAECDIKCKPPKCEISCPSLMCTEGNCPQCHIECEPGECHNRCKDPPVPRCVPMCPANPRCAYRCKRPKDCDTPKCSLVCDDPTCSPDPLCGNLPSGAQPAGFSFRQQLTGNGVSHKKEVVPHDAYLATEQGIRNSMGGSPVADNAQQQQQMQMQEQQQPPAYAPQLQQQQQQMPAAPVQVEPRFVQAGQLGQQMDTDAPAPDAEEQQQAPADPSQTDDAPQDAPEAEGPPAEDAPPADSQEAPPQDVPQPAEDVPPQEEQDLEQGPPAGEEEQAPPQDADARGPAEDLSDAAPAPQDDAAAAPPADAAPGAPAMVEVGSQLDRSLTHSVEEKRLPGGHPNCCGCHYADSLQKAIASAGAPPAGHAVPSHEELFHSMQLSQQEGTSMCCPC